MAWFAPLPPGVSTLKVCYTCYNSSQGYFAIRAYPGMLYTKGIIRQIYINDKLRSARDRTMTMARTSGSTARHGDGTSSNERYWALVPGRAGGKADPKA